MNRGHNRGEPQGPHHSRSLSAYQTGQLSTAHKVGIEDTSLSAGYPCINILKDCRGRPFFRRVDLSPGICKSRFGTVASCCRFQALQAF